ncbi:MAG: polysaccharide deacetylase family protein [Candidatus Binatia bacterium]
MRRTTQWLRHRFAPSALILLYHRVAELPLDPQLLCVTPRHFSEHLEVLRRYARPMRLQELTQALRDGNLPRQGVVVTLDDGYADNFHAAKPLLEHFDIPATVFIASGYLGRQCEFWWDELERLLLQPGTLPKKLCLSVNGNPYQWELGEASHYSEKAHRRHHGWNVLQEDTPSLRHHLYRSLYRMLLPLPEHKRRKVLNEVIAWAGAESMGRGMHRALSPHEVCWLAEGGLVEVGAHTMTHPVLAVLSESEQRIEISGSKARLEEILGHPVTSFSYPYGSQSDYTMETAFVVREAGFACACSNFAELVWRDSDRFQLPRVVVRDWDGEEFARRLWEWFHN